MADNITQLTAEIAALTKTLRDMATASSRIVAAQQASRQSLLDINEEFDQFQKNLVGDKKLNADQQNMLKDTLALKRKEIEAAKNLIKAQQHLQNTIGRFGANSQQAVRANRSLVSAQQRFTTAQAATNTAASALRQSFTGLSKSVNITNAALVWFGSTLKTQAKQLIAQNQANSGVVEGTGLLANALLSQQTAALKVGLSGDAFAKITSQSRQLINAMGGTNKTMEMLNPTLTRFQILTGSYEEALRLSTEAARDFAEKGVKPTKAVMNAYVEDLVQLQRQTGMSTIQAREYYNEISNEIDSIHLLRNAREDERQSILANQRALVQQSIAIGMSATQAKEAAKMLNKMVAAKPLDRLKQAARIRALGGALGIAGADEAARATIAGSRATAEQKQALMQFSQSAANAMDKAAGQGLGTEIFATSLLEKLNLDDYYGKGSQFSTTLADTLKPAMGDLKTAYVDGSKSMDAKLANQVLLLSRQAELLLTGNHYMGVAAAGVTSIAAYLLGGKLLSRFGGALGRGAGAAASSVGGSAATVGRFASGAAKFLGPVAAVGAGAYEGYDEYQKTGKIGSSVGVGVGTAGGALGGAAAGALVGSVVPVVGTIIGGLIGGALGAWGGGAFGKWAGGKFDPATSGSTVAGPQSLESKLEQVASSGDDIKSAAETTADGITTQLRKMDTSNDLLKRIADMTERNIELQERQLIALTMTERERTAVVNRTNLRRENKFGSQYNYV